MAFQKVQYVDGATPIGAKNLNDIQDAILGTKTANGTVVSQNADFAEVAEWADGNPNNEDRTGYFVCANVPVDGIVMKKATSIDDVKGVSIQAPAFAGNYTQDKLDREGNLLPKYSFVAIIGFVPVRDNGTCTVGGRCMPDDNGCAIPSSNSMGYQVVNRIDENRVLIIIEPNGDMVQRIKTKLNEIRAEMAELREGAEITLDVPLVADYVQGEEAFLYPSGLVNTRDLDWHRHKKVNQWSAYDAEYMYGRERIVRVKTDTVLQDRNGYYLQNIADGADITSVTGCRLNVWGAPTNPGTVKNVLIIGDSYTADRKWVEYFKADHLSALSNYKLIGGKITNSLRVADKSATHNGVDYEYSYHTGVLTCTGTATSTAQMYTNIPDANPIAAGTYRYKITCDTADYTRLSIRLTDRNNNIHNGSGENVWVNKDGVIGTIELTDTATRLNITVSSGVTFDNTQIRLELYPTDKAMAGYEATGGYTWNNYTEDPADLPISYSGNPFWIDDKIDVKKYVEIREGAGAKLDYLICMVGINTWVNGAYRDKKYDTDIKKAINSITTLAPQLFEAVHTAYTDCKILLCGYPLPPFISGVNDSKWELLFDRAEFLHRLNAVYRDFETQYDYVRFLHMASNVDSQKAFTLGDRELNYATYQALTADDIHPSDIGYHQIADAVWRGFVGLTNM